MTNNEFHLVKTFFNAEEANHTNHNKVYCKEQVENLNVDTNNSNINQDNIDPINVEIISNDDAIIDEDNDHSSEEDFDFPNWGYLDDVDFHKITLEKIVETNTTRPKD